MKKLLYLISLVAVMIGSYYAILEIKAKNYSPAGVTPCFPADYKSQIIKEWSTYMLVAFGLLIIGIFIYKIIAKKAFKKIAFYVVTLFVLILLIMMLSFVTRGTGSITVCTDKYGNY